MSMTAWYFVNGLVLLAASALMSGGLIVLLRPLLQRYALARPNARSSHRIPTPQGGGIAVVAATVGASAIAVLYFSAFKAEFAAHLFPVLAAAVFIAIVGAVDDIRTIAVAPRLLLQILAAGVVIASLPDELRVVSLLPWWIERALLLLAVVWLVNLVNFMDGIDWMTVAEVVPITGGLVILGMLGALPISGVVVAFALGGAVLGFAPFNRPVARLFLGDVGSLPIGLLLGWLLVLVAGNGHVAAALILPLYYLSDATITLGRRIANREPFWQAHRSHFYQRATDMGFSVPEIVARVFAINLGLVALAAVTVLKPEPVNALVALACAAGLVGWLLHVFAHRK